MASSGYPSEGDTRRWCAVYAIGHPGAVNQIRVVGKRCEECLQKVASYGLPADKMTKRFCKGCAVRHPGAAFVSSKHQPVQALAVKCPSKFGRRLTQKVRGGRKAGKPAAGGGKAPAQGKAVIAEELCEGSVWCVEQHHTLARAQGVFSMFSP